ncbi:MAG: RNA polymerase sigma factor [Planctomycetota bacterium]
MTLPADPTADDALRHLDWLRRLARSLVLDGAEAEDVAQETWLRTASSHAGAADERAPWLAGVMRNVVRARGRADARRRVRERTAARAEAGPSVLEDAVVIERQRALLKRVSALPTEQRRAVLARYYDSRTPREIAALEGIPVATVKSRLKRGLASLREDLDRQHGDRRAWATAIAPLAAPARAALGWTQLAALAALAAAAAFGVATSLGGAPEVTQSTSNVATSPRPQDHDGKRAIELLVVDTAGRPARGVDGRLFSEADRWKIMASRDSSVPDERGLLAVAGTDVRTDDEGIARSRVEGAFVAIFRTEAAIGGLEGDRNLLSSQVELVPARPVLVSIDAEDAATSVVGRLRRTRGYENLAIRGQPPRSNGPWNGPFALARRDLVDGVATFQTDLSLDRRFEPGDRSNSLFLTHFHADVPGLAEFEPEYVVEESHRLHVPGPDPVRVTVRMPPTGWLDLRVLDEDRPLSVQGSATLLFENTRGNGTTVPIVDGVATWPHVVVGSRRVFVDVRLTGPCASYSVQGVGPERAGDRAVCDAPAPTARRYSVRLLSEGQPVRRRQVEVTGPSMSLTSFESSLRGRTDESGRLQFWLGPDQDWVSGHLTFRAPRGRPVADGLEGWFGAPWTAGERQGVEVDLGDVEVEPLASGRGR